MPMSFVIRHLSFVICHLSFVIEHVRLPAFLPTPRQSQPLAHAPRSRVPRHLQKNPLPRNDVGNDTVK